MADYNPVQQAQAGLEGWQASRKNPLDLYNSASAELGLPEVRTRVSTLRKSLLDTENLLSGVEGSVSGRTRGRLVTDAQRSRLVNLERAPITQQYNQIGGQYGMETQNMSDIVGQVGTKSDLAYKGQEQTGDVFKTKLESAKTNYQSQLDAEKEARRQAEADRAYQESVRQYNATLAESRAKRQSDSATANAAKADNARALGAQDIISRIPNRGTSGNGDYHAWGVAVDTLRSKGYSEGEITAMNNYLASRFGSNADKKYFGV